MTPDKLIKTLSLLKMGPRRLVCKGLAPRKLLPAAMKDPRVPLGEEDNNEDLGETVSLRRIWPATGTSRSC